MLRIFTFVNIYMSSRFLRLRLPLDISSQNNSRTEKRPLMFPSEKKRIISFFICIPPRKTLIRFLFIYVRAIRLSNGTPQQNSCAVPGVLFLVGSDMLLSLTTTGHLAVCKQDLSRFITLSEFTDIRKESQSQIAKAPNEIVD